MNIESRNKQLTKGEQSTLNGDEHRPVMSAIGLESEFSVFVDGKKTTAEEAFGNPKTILSNPGMHRVGSSYHIPTGGALYFDSGVIEIATPVIEIEKKCAARAGRSLWEGIQYLRDELDKWEEKKGKDVKLQGFSTHYNISFDIPEGEMVQGRTEKDLALLLAYILPLPAMMLIANRNSTGIGVRPRGNRIEITADFVPSAALMIAATTLITGIVRKVMTWPSYELGMLEQMKIPIIKGYKPIKHTSRKGWLARNDCYQIDPFACDINEHLFDVTQFDNKQSIRDVAATVFGQFHRDVARISGPFSYRLINSVMKGKAPALLDLDECPEAYNDVGKLCAWNNLFPAKELSRSKYERVLICSILRKKIKIDGQQYRPSRMKGWSEVVFTRTSGKGTRTFNIDILIDYLDQWEKSD